MKTVILAGGRGSRLGSETDLRPKPMVEIGGIPIIVHIMKTYAQHGFTDFVVAVGYLGAVIKRFFLDYHMQNRDVIVDLATSEARFSGEAKEDWTVRMMDTGLDTMTGGRLLRLEPSLREEGRFMLTYGDGIADVDISALVAFHRAHGRLATVTAVRPPARFGELKLEDGRVTEFAEKPQVGEGWINGGFFVFEAEVFDYIEGDGTILERSPLERLTQDGQLMAFKHEAFWHCVDTVRDRDELEAVWASGAPPWKLRCD